MIDFRPVVKLIQAAEVTQLYHFLDTLKRRVTVVKYFRISNESRKGNG